MARMNERSSKKTSSTQSKFSKSRVTTKKGKSVPEGRITKSTGNKRNLG